MSTTRHTRLPTGTPAPKPPHRLPSAQRLGMFVLLCCASPMTPALTPAKNFADMSFEELANIEITSVSKKAERLADAAASVFVITAEDLRRSGVTSLPEALRLAPNLQVAQTSNGGYAISARGMNGSNNSAANKLLVLIDGRSIYSPLFSGVFWDVQDVMLEDVERIEVISGPGGTLWGINAVNGVINVITRSAKDTVGGRAVLGGGNRGSDAAFRYGGTLGADGHFRVYGKYVDRNHSTKANRDEVNDGLYRTQAGFRADWQRPDQQFSLQGNVYSGAAAQPAPGAISISGVNLDLGAIRVAGANLTGRWHQVLADGSSLTLQAYVDHTERRVPPTFSEQLDLFDLQVQHSLRPSGRHALVWGANYRYSRDRVENSPYIAFLPANLNQSWASLFAQDEVTLDEHLRLTVGGRVERNDYTGNEFLPNARLAWKLSPTQLLWAAASRTVRAPSRLDNDAFIPGVPPFLLRGGMDIRSEVAKAFEIGYRAQPSADLQYSVTAFHTVYDDLRTQEIAPSRTFIIFGNAMTGTADGLEMWGSYRMSPHWRWSVGYTALRERLRLKANSNDLAAPNAAGNDPAHTWQVRSMWDLGERRELDVTLRHVAALAKNAVPAYTTLDVRFGWKLRSDLELSLIGQNLLGRHAEYGLATNRAEFEPGIYLKLSWRI